MLQTFLADGTCNGRANAMAACVRLSVVSALWINGAS